MNDNENDKKPGNPWTRSLFIWIGILFALVLFVQMVGGGSRAAAGEPIPYSEFVKQVDEGNVRSVIMATGATGNATVSGKLGGGEPFTTTAPADANIADRLVAKGVAVQVKAEESSSIWLLILYNSLPFLLILGISFFVMRQMQKNAGSGAMGFGKSRAQHADPEGRPVTFEDVAGIDEAREELEEIVEYPQGPGQVRAARRQDPQGRAAGRLARHRQDPARPRHRG